MFDQNERNNINKAMPEYLNNMAEIVAKDPSVAVMHELHCELTASITEVMINHNTLHRMPEFLKDYELFIEDMRRKFSTTQEYGYPIRSPYEKLKGIAFSDFNGKALERLKKRKQEHDWGSFDL